MTMYEAGLELEVYEGKIMVNLERGSFRWPIFWTPIDIDVDDGSMDSRIFICGIIVENDI